MYPQICSLEQCSHLPMQERKQKMLQNTFSLPFPPSVCLEKWKQIMVLHLSWPNCKTSLVSGASSKPLAYPTPPGQSVVERAHQTLKRVLDQQCGGAEINSSIVMLCKALFTISFLNNSFSEPTHPLFQHFTNSKQAKLKEQLPVLVKDQESQQIQVCFHHSRSEVGARKEYKALLWTINDSSWCHKKRHRRHRRDKCCLEAMSEQSEATWTSNSRPLQTVWTSVLPSSVPLPHTPLTLPCPILTFFLKRGDRELTFPIPYIWSLELILNRYIQMYL